MKSVNLNQKLLTIGVLLTVLPLMAVFGFVFKQNSKSTELARTESIKMADVDLEHIVDGIYALARSQQEVIEQNIGYALNVAENLLSKAGGLKIDTATEKWEAINQYTKKAVFVSLPKMYAGDEWLGKISRKDLTAPLVDDVLKLVGTTCTVFQKMNEQGDMLRVATNVIKTNGNRAIGTYIPSVNPDGSPNSVVSKVKQGQTYVGRAYVVNGWYITAYKPMYDEQKQLVGVLYVGIPQESTTTLRNEIMNKVIGKTGYVYVLDTKGNYVISQHEKQAGQNILSLKDNAGRYFVQELIDKAKQLNEGEVAGHTYQWEDPEDQRVKIKKVKFAYFKKWDWIIIAGSFEEEFMESAYKIAENSRKNNYTFVIILGISTLLAVVVWFFMARRISRPINVIIGSLNNGAESVAVASKQISSSSQQLAEGAFQQAASVEETSSSMEEIASMIRLNSQNAGQADLLTKEASKVMAEANQSMVRLIQSMQEISTASKETGNIIKNIDDISFQTNLLALNAAVEAARAGESGAGFAVVADEVRNLAMRAADAAKETAGLIETTLSKISDGSDLVKQTNETFKDVFQSFETFANLVAEISESSKEQSEGIEQVNKAISEIDQVVQQNAANAEESASASEEMNYQAKQLRQTVGDLNKLISGDKATG